MHDSNVLTSHNDNSRTGAYLAETTLTPANVKLTTFGKLYERTIQGDIYAQLLFVQSVHTPRGTKNVFFVATSTNDLYAFEADDTNPDPYAGITAENAERLFGAFVTTKSNGMGMGLAICRSIIQAHGGCIWIEPNLTEGAAFHFTLPLHQVAS
jgi:light-regulated signal transduction histidine kinase (bacteriophytochrome)